MPPLTKSNPYGSVQSGFFGANRIKPEREWNLCPIRALRELGDLARRGGDRLWGAGRHFLRIAAPNAEASGWMNIDRIIGLSAWLATIGFIVAIIAGAFG